jgi:hypothetical protein
MRPTITDSGVAMMLIAEQITRPPSLSSWQSESLAFAKT